MSVARYLSKFAALLNSSGQVPASALQPEAQYYGFKNRIINGAMMVSQRGTSFSTPATGSYTLDRWQLVWGGAAPASVAQVAGPSGFKNALQITGAASNTITYVVQKIESANCSDLSGATVTIQVNIAVSSAQTITWNLNYANAADNFSSITGITSGTWSATTTPTTFTATITNLPSGAVNGLQLGIYANNAGAFTSGTVTITGVQLEKGSTATSFDYRPYGTEFMLCQRYYQVAGNAAALPYITVGFNTLSTEAVGLYTLRVPMRVAPSLIWSGTFADIKSGLSGTSMSYAADGVTDSTILLIYTFSGLTAGANNFIRGSGSTNIPKFSAEL